LPEIIRLAGDLASRGHDVLMEGLHLSSEVPLSEQLAMRHCLHILLLNTPAAQCARNLATRRRAPRGSIAAFERVTAEEQRRVEQACARLRACASVEILDFDTALARTRGLLGLEQFGAARPGYGRS
jgi:hypothetical protein